MAKLFPFFLYSCERPLTIDQAFALCWISVPRTDGLLPSSLANYAAWRESTQSGFQITYAVASPLLCSHSYELMMLFSPVWALTSALDVLPAHLYLLNLTPAFPARDHVTHYGGSTGPKRVSQKSL